jgi:CheY-like chemotaxis protein
VQGDPARLQQIASNLLTNAVKFTPAGGTVRVNLERWGDRVTLTVRDTGKGIAPELLDQIFQPFLQGEASSTRRSGGLGLGLAIVQRLVQLHGGAVSASSEGPGLGATFEVVLGAARSTPSAVRGPLAAGRADLTGLSVLVVEDDPDTRELLCGVLTACGARALEACSVQDALTLLDQQRPHVIVSDLAMPAQDGYELVRSVRRMDDARRSVPAIAITARARDADRSVALAAGFQAFLPKPFDVDELVELVLRHALPRDPA